MTHLHLPLAPTGFAHRFETVDDLRLHFVAGGADTERTIVLLAGYPESWFAWRHVMPRLADQYRVIAVDLPGQGDSDRPQYDYDTRTVAERVHALIRRLGIERYYLAAHDVGAWVAFPYALLFGEEVAALTLMDAGIPGITLPENLPATPGKAWKTWHFAFHSVPDLPEQLIEGNERAYLEWFFQHKTADPSCYDEDTIAEYLRIFRAPGGMRAGLAFYRDAGISADQNRELTEMGKLRMPILGLGADQGTVPDIGATLRPFATDVESETISHCGHFQPEERPHAVADALRRFFDQH